MIYQRLAKVFLICSTEPSWSRRTPGRIRLEQHRAGRGSRFVKQYGVHRLVHVEQFSSPQEAIAPEKQLKNWRREWKIQLIEENNLHWSDLSHLL
jgi:putative endonuclease